MLALVGRRGHTTHQGSRRQGSKGCGDGVGRTKKMVETARNGDGRPTVLPKLGDSNHNPILITIPLPGTSFCFLMCQQDATSQATVPVTHCHGAPSLLT